MTVPPEPPPPDVVGEAIVPLERTRSFRFPHLWHRDPDWQTDGIHRYDQCRCGARRTRWINPRMGAPIRPNWPYLTDRHGCRLDDSGWWAPPPGGWPRELTPSEIAAAMPSAALYPPGAMVNDRTPPPSMPPLSSLPPTADSRMEYTTATEPSGNDDAVQALLTAKADDGWRYAGHDGQRYIFERPRQNSPDVHER